MQPDLFSTELMFKARDTSIEAAEKIAPASALLRFRVLDALKHGPMTADECAGFLGIDKLAIRPRFSELASQGRIEDTEERRQNTSGKKAIVWRLS